MRIFEIFPFTDLPRNLGLNFFSLVHIMLSITDSNRAGYKRTMDCPNTLKYDANLTLKPGTMMTVFQCPVEGCGKNSCTDIKSFKLHCLHVHQDRELAPIVTQSEARFICQVENCGKLYLEKKQYEIHQRHHKTYVPSTGRYFKCQLCDTKFNSQGNLDVHNIQVHMNGSDSDSNPGKNDLIFDDITLAPGTMMSVYHCPVTGCGKRNYLDAKSAKTHCRRFHSMSDFDPFPAETEAQFICQVRGCRKLFVETVQIEAHLKHHRNYIPTNGNFECKLCPQAFTRKDQLDQHILNFHTYDGMLKSQEQQQKNQQVIMIDQNQQMYPQNYQAQIKHTVHGSIMTQDGSPLPMGSEVNTPGYQKTVPFNVSILI